MKKKRRDRECNKFIKFKNSNYGQNWDRNRIDQQPERHTKCYCRPKSRINLYNLNLSHVVAPCPSARFDISVPCSRRIRCSFPVYSLG